MLRSKISFKNSDIHFEEKIITQDKCPICFDEFLDAQEIAVLACGHTFCQECANNFLKTKKSCPICRKEPLKGYRPLHFWK